MKNIPRKNNLFRIISSSLLVTILAASANVHSEISFASDWDDKSSTHTATNKAETTLLESAALETARLFTATPKTVPYFDRGFQLYIDGVKFYIKPSLFMEKHTTGEMCTPTQFTRMPTYQCNEGQRETSTCHLLFFNSKFENVGVYPIHSKEPYEYFCNSIIAMSVYSHPNNEFLVTHQYFPIDHKAAEKVSQLGSGWKRMTSLFKLTLADGKVRIEEKSDCLKNPNSVDTTAAARKILARCERQKIRSH